ncbi:MAG: 23S rRNA (pseudouridine(1915)-N(3))-methyltransferase RlmH, partial [Bacteroidaceae bacterium]|nr:23S rRNA (pseudouridine(1915)-N(3))-methyltransferase RlmH [Bacteroidaceae bacterium]
MKGLLIVVGKTTDKRFEAIINEYVERIRHYIPFAVEVIPELKNTKGLSQNEQKEREGELIQKSLQ